MKLLRAVLPILCMTAVVLHAAGAAEEAARKQFLAWYGTFTGSVMPPEVLKGYAAKLAAGGASESEVAEHIDAVRKYMSGMPPELLTVHFNKIYAAHQELFSQEPNAFLVSSVRGVASRRNSVE